MHLARYLIVSLALVVPSTLLAQESSPSPEEAKEQLTAEQKENFVEFVKAGKEAYSRGEFEKAVPFFEHAYSLVPRPALHYRIALCHERSGHPKKALEFYRKFLDAKPESSKRGQVEKTISRLEKQLRKASVATVSIATDPAGAEVYVRTDDAEHREEEARGDTPLELELSPGRVEVTFEKEGYKPLTKTVEVAAGEKYNLSYGLTEIEQTEPSAKTSTPPSEPAPAPQAKRSNALPIVAAIIGGVGAIGGGTLYGIGTHCGSNTRSCSRGLFNAAALGSYIGGAVGVAGLGTATIVWLTRSGETTAHSRTEPRLKIRLSLSPNAVGITGSF